MSKKNRFEDLLKKTNNENTEYLTSSESPLISVSEDQKVEEERAEKETSTETEIKQESISKEALKEKKRTKENVSQAAARFFTKKPEVRSVKKGFLLTKTNADWLKKVADETSNSENEIINQILDMQRMS